MADYYPLIARAIAGLDPNAPGEARRALYARARTALIQQLRGVQPPLSESEITRERLSLSLEEAPSLPPLPVDEPPPAPPTPPTRPEPKPRPPVSQQEMPRFDEPAAREEAQPIRPRVAPPRKRGVDPGHIRTAIVGGGVALTVAVIAGAAFYVNKIAPQDQQVRAPRVETQAPPAQQDQAGKISERAGGEQAPTPSQPSNQRPSQQASAPAR
jgi:hypothetical protein